MSLRHMMRQVKQILCATGLMWLAASMGCSPAFAAESAGEVVYAHGLTSIQRTGEPARFVTKGDAINEGDVISTGPKGFAVIGLKDGTKMTLRPDTSFAVEKFSHGGKEEAGFFRLVKGGVRAITGLIGKRNPQGMRVSTTTATIGIRGTSFDARLCEADCAKDVRAARKDVPPSAERIVARVATHSGTGSLIATNGETRPISNGAPLFNGDTVRTDKGAYAVVAFRDRSKITVIADSEFKLENVRFGGAQSDEGNFVVRIVKGGVRALTGLLAKREPKTVQFNMLTATVGIRGTGLDGRLALDCVAGSCSESAFAHIWEGAVALQVGDRSLDIPTGRAGVFNPAQDRLALLDAIPQFFLDETAPRPDGVEVDFDNLFALVGIEGFPAGLYVGMQDGHVNFAGSGGFIDLGPGEAGYVGEGQNVPIRLRQYPAFLLTDPYPRPDKFDEQTLRLLDVLNPGGGPGNVICEM
jgi:hypothetical protein